LAAEHRLSREEKSGPAAMAIKRFNRAAMFAIAGALVVSRLPRRKGGKATIPDERDLMRLHEAAMRFLVAKPGRWRDYDFHIVDEGQIVFRGAPAAKLPRLMRRYFRDLEGIWTTGDALDVAAYALWWIAWIHPFDDGNGRASVAFAYVCFSLKIGARLPGLEETFDSIISDRARYRAFIKASDHARATIAGPSGMPDLWPLKDYLDGLLAEDLAAAALSTG